MLNPAKTIRESLDLAEVPENKVIRKKEEEYIPPTPEIVAKICDVEPEEVKFTSKVKAGVSTSDVGAAQVKKFVALLEAGVGPKEAAESAGSTTKELVKDKRTQAILQEVLDKYSIDLSVIKAVVRASRQKVLVEALKDNDAKMILEATKHIATDPGVGLVSTAPVQPQGSFVSDEFAKLLSSFSGENKIEVGEVIDAEVEEVDKID